MTYIWNKEREKMKKSHIFIICLFCVFFALSGCSKKPSQTKEDVIPVRVMKITSRDIQKTLDYVGDIRAEEQAIVYPRASGKIVEKLKEDGSAVNKGDIIAYIDRDEVGFDFEKLPVESFLAGIVGRVYVDKGAYVTPQTPVALVVKMDNVEIGLDIPEKYLPNVFPGQTAEIGVDAYPEEVFIGKVTKISPIVDLDTRTAPIEISVSNKDYRLGPGMFARVKLIIKERKNVPVVLQEAIVSEKCNPYVYVVKENISYRRDVKLGLRKGPYYEVTEGLTEGDVVVIMGQQLLTDGTQVLIEETGNTY
ncbi:MAG: hypothetical protein A2Z72_06900 [Omnitrophica bacterium RBG_13_46_9]|nr:MAG: hypothetical protein A2Z72_06900 [Omnitrophica bacterium RBG_13_46_9]